MGMVNDMPQCQKKCCGFSACDLAFLLGGRCYLVGCADEKSCQMNKAKPSAYAPTISYVTRWNTEGVKHTGNGQFSLAIFAAIFSFEGRDGSDLKDFTLFPTNK